MEEITGFGQKRWKNVDPRNRRVIAVVAMECPVKHKQWNYHPTMTVWVSVSKSLETPKEIN
jgi:hypothetical protein